jgi:hypothetical protein
VSLLSGFGIFAFDQTAIGHTGLWLAYCLGSLTWSAGSLTGFLSKVDKKLFAKVTSDMIVRW